jgi:hypothetical protein
MSVIVRWARDNVDEGVWRFPSEEEGTEAARSVEGTALVFKEPVGSVTVFRHGRELDDADAAHATLSFGHHIEVGISRAAEPETNIDPDDSNGRGVRPGTPAVWGWRVWRGKDGPTPWVGTYATRDAARASAEEAQREDLADLSILDIGPEETR